MKVVSILGGVLAIFIAVRAMIMIWDTMNDRADQVTFEFAILGLAIAGLIIGVSVLIWQT